MAKASEAYVRAGEREVRISSPRSGDLRGDRPHAGGHQADGRGVLHQRRGRPDAGAARPADRARAVDVRRPSRDEAGDGTAGPQRRRVLPEAGAQGRARLPRDRDDHLPVRAHGRRDLPDRDRGAGVVRAHGHADLPPVAGASRRRGPPRRAADRPRPAAGHDVRRRRARRWCRPRAARRPRHDRLREDLGQPRRSTSTSGSSPSGTSRPSATPPSPSAASWRSATTG